MLIKRTTATRIMGKAISLDNSCLLAILEQDEQLTFCDNPADFESMLRDHPTAISVYNQNPQALEIIDRLVNADGQQSIEVFQDTEGVFGLRAYRINGKMQSPVTLELSDLVE